VTAVLYLFAVACLSGAGGCFDWALRARLAVKRGESTARAEREAAIKACAKRHKDACAVYQHDRVEEWTGGLEREQLRELERRVRSREDIDRDGQK
jgi:hypothetical protein